MHDQPRTVSFGPFHLDLRTGELRKGVTRLKVPDQSVQILTALLEQPGDLVTREELRGRLWPADTFVDFEHGLNTAVRRLRAALGDSAETPRFIETLPRRGYRFIGVIESAVPVQPKVDVSGVCEPAEWTAPPLVTAPAEDAHSPEGAMPAQLAVNRKRQAWRVPVTLAALLLSGAGLLGMSWRARTVAPDPVELPFTAMEGDELAGRFSPDGREVVFTWAKDGRPADVYLKAVGSEIIRPFVTTDDDEEVGPVFSPDGQFIAFLRLGPKAATVIVKSRDGGPERPITSIANPHVTFIGSPGPYLAWTADSQGLIYSHEKALHLWRLADGRSTQLTHPPPSAARGDVDPALSPDGRTLVFVRDGSTGASDLYSVSLNDRFAPSGAPVLLLSNGYWNRSPAWSPDGRHVVFASGHWGQQRLWSMEVKNPSTARPLQGASADAHQPAVSPTTGTVLYTRWAYRRHIWTAPLTGTGDAAGAPRPLLASMRSDTVPRFGRDGSHFVFDSDRSGSFEVWISSSDGTDLRKVTSFNGPPAGCGDLSPDGQSIVFDYLVEGQRDIGLVDRFGANLRRLTDHASDDVCPRWSSDGRSIYFTSQRSGLQQIWKLELDTGRARVMSPNRGHMATESADGRTLYFTAGDGRSTPLLAMPTSGGPVRVVVDGIFHRGYATTEHGLYYVPDSAPTTVHFLDFATNQRRELARLPHNIPLVAVDPRATNLLIGQPGPAPGDLILLHGAPLR
jgi:Tol biopolymer transport system component/DNA-binding winged helix-turn-helix (wHTH) protein